MNDRRSRELNPCDEIFWTSRGWPYKPTNWRAVLDESGYYDSESDEEYDTGRLSPKTLKSRKNNPCDPLFWKSRGWPRRPYNWEDVLDSSDFYNEPDSDDDGDSYTEYYSDDDTEYYPDDDLETYPNDGPEQAIFWISRGWPRKPLNWRLIIDRSGYYDTESEDDDIGNRSNLKSRQKNPCDQFFWKSRGWPRRPNNWKDILRDSGFYDHNEVPVVRATTVNHNVSSSTPRTQNATANTPLRRNQSHQTPNTSRLSTDDYMRTVSDNTPRPQNETANTTSRSNQSPSTPNTTTIFDYIRTVTNQTDVDPYDYMPPPQMRNPLWKAIKAVEYTNDLPENNLCSSCVIYVKTYFLRCGHVLCAKCAEHLYNRNSACPFCRKKIDTEPIQIFLNV